MLPRLRVEQDAELESIYSSGETYVSASPHATAYAVAASQLGFTETEPVRAPVANRLDAQPSRRATITAGADVAERDAAQPVAAEPVVVVAEANTAHSDSVQHARQSRLSRWQAQR